MTDREWYGRVLLAMFAVNTLLAVMVALVSVSRFELDGGFSFSYWLVFVGPAVMVGFLAALGSWTLTVGVSLAIARFLNRVPRAAAVATGLAVPGIVALIVYRPWEQPSHIEQPAQLPEIAVGLAVGAALAVIVVHRVNQAAARTPLIEAE
ncbi:hypothetical protein [Microcella sp.]|uniref:hypothetical protein n=1 Tax=Microcella sp. TaxID=1913979 RepID=UPI00391D2611